MNKNTQYTNWGMSTYRTCPRKFKNEIVDKRLRNKKQLNPYLSFDRSIHNSIGYINSLTPDILSQIDDTKLTNIIQRYWLDDGYETAAEVYKFRIRAKDMLMSYINCNINSMGDALLVNRIIRYHSENRYKLCARIDKVCEHNDGSIEIVDYKTGNIIDVKLNLNINYQLPLYLTLVHEELGIQADYISYHYLAHDKKLTYKVTPENIEMASKFLNSYIFLIKNDNTYKCNPNPYCED